MNSPLEAARMVERSPRAAVEPTSLRRRTLLSAVGATGIALAGVGAFAGTVAAWKRFEVDFRGCSEVWLVVDEEDLNFEKYDRDEPLFVKVVIETADGEAACRTVEFTEKTTTTIPGQYGDAPLVKFSAGDEEKILAVIEYNHNDIAICYVENDHRCANTPNVADWRESDCYGDLLEPENPDPDRFNAPCSEPDRSDPEPPGSGRGPPRTNGILRGAQ